MKFVIAACTLLLCLGVQASVAIDQYETTKSDLTAAEQAAREMMSKLYEINTRMKNMSRLRDRTNNKLIDVQSRAQALAKDQAHLEGIIESQRVALSRRLRTLYMLGENQLMRLIFSATSSQDLYQNMKYMRLVTENDYKLIKSHQITLAKLKVTKQRLQSEVKKLIAVQTQLRKQEVELEKEQAGKTQVLAALKNQKNHAIAELKQIRSSLSESDLGLLNFTFFEHKGRLPSPVTDGEVARKFGVIEHPEYGYRLSHKGLTFTGQGHVTSVFEGRVVFAGQIAGYGNTLILDHGDHYYTVYANLAELKQTSGQVVKQRELLSKYEGKIYFEIRHFSDPIDPNNWIMNGDKNET